MPMTRRISLSRLCWCGARSSSAASRIPSDTSRRTVWRNRCGSGRARLRPKAGSRASAVRSAATCPTGPGRFPGAQRRGQRGPCGLRRVHRTRRPGARGCRDTAAAARCLQAGLGALGDQSPFELGDGAQHLQRERALRCCGGNRVAQAAKMCTIGFELLDDGVDLPRPCQSVRLACQ
jgi:hypothetical protein